MKWELLFRGLVAVALAAGAVAVMVGMFDAFQMEPDGVGVLVFEHLEASGVDHSVTAVLMNFRAYDTLLEIVVLTVAFWGGWSLRVHREPALSRAPPVLLARVSAVLVPVLIMLAVYLLWVGSHRPGGEFQAGAVLGAAGILTLLVGRPVPGARRVIVRQLFVVTGASVFIGLGVLGWFLTGHVLGYRPEWAKTMIVIIETAAALSIGFILVALFAGSVERLAGDVEVHAVGPGLSEQRSDIEYRSIDKVDEIEPSQREKDDDS